MGFHKKILDVHIVYYWHADVYCWFDSVGLAGKCGEILAISGVTSFFLRITQYNRIYQEALEEVIYSKKFLANRTDLQKIWENVSTSLFESRFPEVHAPLLDIIIKKYFPMDDNVSYYTDIKQHLLIKWKGEKRDNTIEIEDDAFFPYGVRFNYRRVEKVDGVWRTVSHENSWVWFENPNETQTVPDADNNGTVPDSAKQIGSYEFSLHSERKDPNKLVKAGFRLGVTRDADGKRVNESAYVPLVMDRQSWDPVQHEWVRDGYWGTIITGTTSSRSGTTTPRYKVFCR